MTNFTSTQLALQAHIEAQNAQFVADCEARGATFWTTTVSDPAHWAEYGIHDIEGYEKHSLVSYISDAHKDAYGVRPRGYNWDAMSIAELQEWADELSDAVRRESEREAERVKSHIAEFEELVRKTIELGADDRATALRWLTSDEDVYQDVEGWVYNMGFLFSDYGRALVAELNSVVYQMAA